MGAGALILPRGLAAASSEKNPDSEKSHESVKSTETFKGNVLIIGAGAAGLHAAWLLNKQGVNVTVLEASSVYGGRIRSLDNFSEFPIELGADKIYGKKSMLYDLVKKANAKFAPTKGEPYYALDGYVNTEAQLEEDADFKAAIGIRDTLAEYSGPNMTLDQFASRQGLKKRILPLFNALLANPYGASLKQIGIKPLIESESRSDASVMQGTTMLSLLTEKYRSILDKIKLNSPVVSVEHFKDSIHVTDKSGTVYSADKVLITVPLAVLKANDIKFLPVLHISKTSAFEKIGTGPGLRVLLKFSKRFWKDDSTSIYSPGPVPEFVVTGPVRNNVLTATVYGEGAALLSGMGEGASAEVLKQLDKIYGGNVATRTVTGSTILDWTKEPFIKGGISYPSLDSAGMREIAAASIDKKLYFAGEAMNTSGRFGTIHGAIETAQTAVDEMLKL